MHATAQHVILLHKLRLLTPTIEYILKEAYRHTYAYIGLPNEEPVSLLFLEDGVQNNARSTSVRSLSRFRIQILSIVCWSCSVKYERCYNHRSYDVETFAETRFPKFLRITKGIFSVSLLLSLCSPFLSCWQSSISMWCDQCGKSIEFFMTSSESETTLNLFTFALHLYLHTVFIPKSNSVHLRLSRCWIRI